MLKVVEPATISLREYVDFFLKTSTTDADASRIIVKCDLVYDGQLRWVRVDFYAEMKYFSFLKFTTKLLRMLITAVILSRNCESHNCFSGSAKCCAEAKTRVKMLSCNLPKISKRF